MSMSLFLDKDLAKSVTLTGADTQWQTIELVHPSFVNSFFLKFFFGQTGIEVGRVRMEMIETREEAMAKWQKMQEEAGKQD